MSVNFDSALMRSKAIASLDHASFRVYFVLSQHCVELRSTRIAAPSFTQLHSAIAPECGGISIGMFRKSLLSLESAGFLKICAQGRVKIFDLLGVRESYPDVDWFDRAVLILEESADASSAPLPLGEGNQRARPEPVERGEGSCWSGMPIARFSPSDAERQPVCSSSGSPRQSTACSEPVEGDDGRQTNSAVGVSTSLPAHDSSIRISPSGGAAKEGHQSSLLAAPPDAGLRTNSAADGNPDVIGVDPESPDGGKALGSLASQNASLPLSPFGGILGTTSVDLCDLCGKTPSSGSSASSSAQANPTSVDLCDLCGKTPSPGSSPAAGNADVVGSSSDSSAQANPASGTTVTFQGDAGHDLCGKTPASASSSSSRVHLPLATQKALLEDLRKRTAAVLARVHRDFPQSRPIRWGSQDPSSPFDDEDADAPGSASDGV